MHRLIQTCHLAVHHWPMDAQLTFAHPRLLPAMRQVLIANHCSECCNSQDALHVTWRAGPLGPPPHCIKLKVEIDHLHVCMFLSFSSRNASFYCNRRLFPGPTLQCLCGQCHWYQHHHFLGAHQLSTEEQYIHQYSGGYHRHHVGC